MPNRIICPEIFYCSKITWFDYVVISVLLVSFPSCQSLYKPVIIRLPFSKNNLEIAFCAVLEPFVYLRIPFCNSSREKRICKLKFLVGFVQIFFYDCFSVYSRSQLFIVITTFCCTVNILGRTSWVYNCKDIRIVNFFAYFLCIVTCINIYSS